MSQITITIKTDNSAFDDELVRILRDLARRIARDGILDTWLYDSELRDINGNKCGQLAVQS
jgi:hypothetical protein